jgi:UDP-N-acetylmuramoyl-L-alanyl-D-glutamate--2,6-diaminopimelate ligase
MAPQIAAMHFEFPSEKLFCVGVTGTNGKTSITYLIEHFFNHLKRPTGVIGTINHHVGSRIWPTEMTTPHPIELQQRLHEFLAAGAQTLAIEVSSHALDQKRIAGIEFDVGVFTNLTRDHLDYHSTMKEYFEVKQTFFTEILNQSKKKKVFAIINGDDPWGKKINPGKRAKVWTYGAKNTDFGFKLKSMNFLGTEFSLDTPLGSAVIKSPLIGTHNIYNVMAAVATGLAGDLELVQLEDLIQSFGGIPGRLQLVPNNKGIAILVDYAHSPDALENVLMSLQKVRRENKTTGKIICLFGCGGDRDKGKRPLMAQVAQKLSDTVIVTSDNPRTEDPLQIINEIKAGFDSTLQNPFVEADRAKAITLAIEYAKANDVILIAGKGHEDYQIIGKEKFFFSDFEIARTLLL